MPDSSAIKTASPPMVLGLRPALASRGLWLLAVAAAGGMLLATGPGPGWLAVVGSLAGLAIAGSVLLGSDADRRERRLLAGMARAAGLADRPEQQITIASIVHRLGN